MKKDVLTRNEVAGMWRRALAAGAALALCALPVAARQGGAAETPPAKPAATAAKQSPPQKEFTLRVSKSTPHTFKLTAKDALLGDVTAELSRRLDVPIRLSPLMAKQRVNHDFSGLNLETTLRMLAPHPYVDYVAGGDDLGQPKPLAIYLYAMNEKAPSLNETVKNNVSALLIEGDTEEGTEEYEKRRREKPEPLAVTFKSNRLSVRAEKQPLSVVLFKIASEMGIPFDLQSDTTEVVDLEFNGYTVEQAMRTLSPSVRFFYRADLLNFETYPIRIALAPPASPSSGPNKAQD